LNHLQLKVFLPFLIISVFSFFIATAQQAKKDGVIIGTVIDTSNQKAIMGATVAAIPYSDSSKQSVFLTDKNGGFTLNNLQLGYYRVRISAVGYRTLTIDSIHLRTDRADFNLNDLPLSNQSVELAEVIIFVEKPLIESKDGNITFNVGESALSNGSNATELLKQTPLVTTDADGKIAVRGKEPKILIDDKPVELNAQQLQDLLESMPGSMIEKIEVLTNPPPQYANEQGGVINIVTKKGRVGFGARVSLYAGSRGQTGISSNFNYRKQGFAVNLNAGVGYNEFQSEGYSNRTNIYKDSSNQLKIINNSFNKSIRPSFRLNVDYELNKRNSFNFVAQYNQGNTNNSGFNRYTNLNRFEEISRLSERTVASEGSNRNPSINISYTRKTKRPGESLRVVTAFNLGWSENIRNYFQEFLNADDTPTGVDSTQKQTNNNKTNGYSINIIYDRPLGNKKTSLSTGLAYYRNNNHVVLTTEFMKKPENIFQKAELLSNNFKFHQDVISTRAAIKHLFMPGFSITAGSAFEQTNFLFELFRDNKTEFNRYFNVLPFANVNRSWKNGMNLTVAYRRTMRRPGIGELNPAIDYGDPYNLRYGNPDLLPSQSHTFDIVTGKTKSKYFANMSVGYNLVEDVFSQIRTLAPDGKTTVTWDNVSNRQEYEASTWAGLTISRKLRSNISASYTYNKYGTFDKEVRKFRDGGSFTSNFSTNYNPTDLWTFTGAFSFNRFANPQGTVRSNISMNIGVQHKLFKKKVIISINTTDPFIQQQNRVFTYGPNFNLESYNRTQTRNYRVTLSYNFNKTSTVKRKTVDVLKSIKK
jgi:hypothetical protein